MNFEDLERIRHLDELSDADLKGLIQTANMRMLCFSTREQRVAVVEGVEILMHAVSGIPFFHTLLERAYLNLSGGE